MSHYMRTGFTVIELSISLLIGIAIIQISLVAFFFIQKFTHNIERLSSLGSIVQATILWSINNPKAMSGLPQSTSKLDALSGSWGIPISHPQENVGYPDIGIIPSDSTTPRWYTITIRDFQRKTESLSSPRSQYDWDIFMKIPVMWQ